MEPLESAQELIERKDSELKALRAQLERLRAYVEELELARDERDAILKSRSFRIVRGLRALAPAGTRRWAVLIMGYRMLRYPRSMMKALTPDYASPFFKAFLKGDGIEAVKVTNPLIMDGLAELPPPVMPLPGLLPIGPEVPDGAPPAEPLFELPVYQHPRVSIIIPVYNGWQYTLACLKSIQEQTFGAPFEVILADDLSTDYTRQAASAVKGLILHRNGENLGFIKNCNAAAKVARGEYLLFLNNDTQVMEDWLSPLVALMDSDPKVGIAGSKLLYPDGTLQEAGGITWRDGSAWNYGRGFDPARPEYNYVRDVDYVSGAALMVRRALFEELGGFDQRFAPAYYEDNDLCFAARRAGYRVLYQPASQVVHFEGKSNGVDTGAGVKQYQLDNAVKMREKWADELAKRPPNGEGVFRARENAPSRGVVLVVDHYVPEFDRDAGSRNTYLMMRTMLEMGYTVKFLGDNRLAKQPYTAALQQLGIEVIYGSWYGERAEHWIRQNGKYLDFAYLNRPHIAVKYMELLRECSRARIIYHGHDLHYAREMSAYEITHDEACRARADEWYKLETSLMASADVIATVSAKERDIIKELAPGKPVVLIPVFYYDSFPQPDESAVSGEGLLFVGGFGHTPNVDGVGWLVQEVLPLLPEHIRLDVAGSSPPESVKALASPRVTIHGFVSDEALARLYQGTRVVTVALRFGAGVKGKTIEALHSGKPVVTTRFGIEGLEDIERVISPMDDAQAFAREIMRLYDDGAARLEAAQRNVAYVAAHFSDETARRGVGGMFS